MYERQEVSNTALHNFPRPQTFKKEIRNENQDQRKIFDPSGIWTQYLRIISPLLYQLSYEAGSRYPSADRWAGRLSIAFDGAIGVAFDGALKVEVPAIEGTRGERTTAGLMPLGLFLFHFYFPFFGGHLPQASGFRSARQILVASFATQVKARILSGRYIFCTPGEGQQRRALMPLGLFLLEMTRAQSRHAREWVSFRHVFV